MSKFNQICNEITNIIGDPYLKTERTALYCTDSLVSQKKLHNQIFDLIVTSPPYNIGKEYETVKPVEDYVNWSTEWINDATNLLTRNGALMLNVGYISLENKGRAIPIPYLLWDKIPLFLQQEIVWNYSAGVACKNYLSPRNEKILWYVKNPESYIFNLDAIRDPNVKYPNSKRNGKLRVNTLGKNPSDVWEIAKVTTGRNRSSAERTNHPCQFPTDLINRVILGFSNIDDIVFDPFVGSGTTLESCVRNNRYSIGFEIREDYCQIVKERILSLQEENNNIFSIESSLDTKGTTIQTQFQLS